MSGNSILRLAIDSIAKRCAAFIGSFAKHLLRIKRKCSYYCHTERSVLKECGVERIANYINNGGLVEIKEYAAIPPQARYDK